MSEPQSPSSPRPLAIRLLRSVAGWASILLLGAFALWLLKLLYIDRSWEEEMMGRYRSRERTNPPARVVNPQRFHLDIPYSLDTLLDPPVCFSCHTAYPHRANERSRSYLNMHGAFLACEVCHTRPGETGAFEYVWFSDRGDQPVREVEGSRGVYGAHIFPAVRDGEGRLRRLGKRVNEPEWFDLSERVQGMPESERAAAAIPAHSEVRENPIDCRECHRAQGLLDFRALGYSAPMAARLERLEVVEMLEGTTRFHFPDLRGTVTALESSP
ncbi:MAG: hypothetical protein HUU25_12165 [Candidatus Sumerlaeia bacterium]|nr:hypothetical protein [Candidatus Sumerlaeia bacterium]